MRRLSILTLFILLLLGALLPTCRSFVVGAVSEGERLAMYSKPSVVRIIDGVAGTFYYQQPNRNGKTYDVSYIGLGSGRYSKAIPNFEEVKRLFPEHSEVSLLIQGSQQAIAEGKERSGFPWVLVLSLLVVLFVIVAIIVIGVTIFLISRRRSQTKPAVAAAISPGPTFTPTPSAAKSERPLAPATPSYTPTPPAAAATPSYTPTPPAAANAEALTSDHALTVDLSRTVAINVESDTSPINLGSIKFVSGPLAGKQFEIKPDGSYIGRDSSQSQIVLPDPRISKRHLWIGVRDGRLVIADQGSRNGTFVNDPKSQRVTETTLNSGDTVILGESDVARFEYTR